MSTLAFLGGLGYVELAIILILALIIFGSRLPGVARWNDGRFIRWGESDAEVTARMGAKLAAQLAEVAQRAEAVVATIHHLPFAALVMHAGDIRRDFANAFMGSPQLGEVLLAEPKFRLCLTGHSHTPADLAIGADRAGGPLRVVNPGSNYAKKELARITLTKDPPP